MKCGTRFTKSFYSKYSHLLLVIYWYSPYAFINATLKASRTKCKAIAIDFCLQWFCIFRSKKSCAPLLNSLTAGSDLRLLWSRPQLKIELVNGTCSVLQVRHSNKLYKQNRKPYVNVWCINMIYGDLKMTSNFFFGTLKQEVSHFISLPQNTFYLKEKEHLSFRSGVAIRKICFDKSCYSRLRNRRSRNIKYHDSIHVITDVHEFQKQYKFQFCTKTIPPTDAWVDIIINPYTDFDSVQLNISFPFVASAFNHSRFGALLYFDKYTLLLKAGNSPHTPTEAQPALLVYFFGLVEDRQEGYIELPFSSIEEARYIKFCGKHQHNLL